MTWKRFSFSLFLLSLALPAALSGGPATTRVVVRFGDHEIHITSELMYALGDHNPGEDVQDTVERGRTAPRPASGHEAGGGGR